MKTTNYGTTPKMNKFYIVFLGILASFGIAFAAKRIYDATRDGVD